MFIQGPSESVKCLIFLRGLAGGTSSQGKKLCGDANGDLCGIIAAEGQAEGADDFFEEVGRKAIFAKLADEDGALGSTADGTDKRQRGKSQEYLPQNRPIGSVAMADGEHEGVAGKVGHSIFEFLDAVMGDVFQQRQSGKPVCADIKDIDTTGKGGEHGDKGLANVARAKNGDVPWRLGAEFFKQQAHLAAAGHASIVLKIPDLQARWSITAQDFLGVGDGFGFDFPTTEVPNHEAFGGDEGLPTHCAGHATAGGSDGDDDAVHTLAVEFCDFFPKIHRY